MYGRGTRPALLTVLLLLAMAGAAWPQAGTAMPTVPTAAPAGRIDSAATPRDRVAQPAAAANRVYLPLLLKTVISSPAFVIDRPQDGITLTGTTLFAVHST